MVQMTHALRNLLGKNPKKSMYSVGLCFSLSCVSVFRGPAFVLNFEPLRFAILNLFVICGL